jgi:hypothetical protein
MTAGARIEKTGSKRGSAKHPFTNVLPVVEDPIDMTVMPITLADWRNSVFDLIQPGDDRTDGFTAGVALVNRLHSRCRCFINDDPLCWFGAAAVVGQSCRRVHKFQPIPIWEVASGSIWSVGQVFLAASDPVAGAAKLHSVVDLFDARAVTSVV